MPFNTHDKVCKCFHPKFINFNNELSFLIFFNSLRKVEHADLKILNKVDMAVKVPKVVKVFSKCRQNCVTDINFRKWFLIYICNFLLNLLQFSLDYRRILMLEQIIKMQWILDPVFILIILWFKGIEKLRHFHRLIEVNKVSEPSISFIMHHNVQKFLFFFGRQIFSKLVRVECFQSQRFLFLWFNNRAGDLVIMIHFLGGMLVELLQIEHAFLFIHFCRPILINKRNIHIKIGSF